MAVVAGKGIWLWAAELGPARVAALIAAGRTAEAAGLTAAFGRGLRGRDIPAARAGLGLCRALLAQASGEHLRAAGLFGRAAGAYLAMPRPYDALLARQRQAACLLLAGRTEAGKTLARQVAGQLTALGAHGDAQRVSNKLRVPLSDGRRPSTGRPGYGDQLSPRELDVARLLVSGGTNAEIAEQLFLSPKTVARHLESAMRKLGVGSRTALAVRAVETGLVPSSAAETTGP
jgi:DNA-binding NarL/FixJ family response regulator